MQTIYLDISNKGVVPTIYAKQGDVGRKFLVVLTDSGIPYAPPAGSVFSVWYDGASGEGNYTDVGSSSAVIVNANTVKVELITQMLQNEGEGKLCLVLNNANGDQISSWNISYICEAVPGHKSEEAKAYFTAFSNAVQNLPYPDVSLSTPGKAADAGATGEALAGKAPAGYGLGEDNGNAITTLAQLDSVKVNSFRNYYGEALPVDGAHSSNTSQGGVLTIYGQGCITQYFFLRYPSRCSVLKRCTTTDGSVWESWEWVNPPMIPGVEYRTTERWNGKPVYTKLIDYGDVGAGYSSLSTGCGNRVIRAAVTHGNGIVPFDGVGAINNNHTKMFGVDNNKLHFFAGSDVGTANLSAQLWYIKD